MEHYGDGVDRVVFVVSGSNEVFFCVFELVSVFYIFELFCVFVSRFQIVYTDHIVAIVSWEHHFHHNEIWCIRTIDILLMHA